MQRVYVFSSLSHTFYIINSCTLGRASIGRRTIREILFESRPTDNRIFTIELYLKTVGFLDLLQKNLDSHDAEQNIFVAEQAIFLKAI